MPESYSLGGFRDSPVRPKRWVVKRPRADIGHVCGRRASDEVIDPMATGILAGCE